MHFCNRCRVFEYKNEIFLINTSRLHVLSPVIHLLWHFYIFYWPVTVVTKDSYTVKYYQINDGIINRSIVILLLVTLSCHIVIAIVNLCIPHLFPYHDTQKVSY